MIGKLIRDVPDLLNEIRRNESGATLVEFAILCPVLLVLYLGGANLCEAIACARKVTSTARTVSDLTTQYSSITGPQVDAIMSASAQIMHPYKGADAVIRVSQIQIDSNGVGKVIWSRGKNIQGRVAQSDVVVDPLLATPNTVYIYSEASYAYTPSSRFFFKGDFAMGDSFVMLPRISTKVNCNGC